MSSTRHRVVLAITTTIAVLGTGLAVTAPAAGTATGSAERTASKPASDPAARSESAHRTPAGAATAPAPAGATRPRHADWAPPDAVRALREAAPGISARQARLRLAAENDRAALLEQVAADPAYGGAWYDPGTDTQHLQATTAAAADRFSTLAAERGIDVLVHRVEHTYRRLLAEVERASDHTYRVSGATTEAHARLDVRNNRVEIALPEDDRASAEARLPSGVHAVARTDRDPAGLPMVDDACTGVENCGTPLRAGLMVQDATSGDSCSTGFTADGARHPSTKWVLLAAHCGNVGDTFRHDGRTIGELGRKRFGSDAEIDAAVVRVRHRQWLGTGFGWLYNPENPQHPLPVTDVLPDRSVIQDGQVVCIAARSMADAHQCGIIDGTDELNYPRVRGVDPCPGDSGGAWYRPTPTGNVAYGLHKGGSTGCHGDAGGDYGTFSDVATVEDALDVRIHTRPGSDRAAEPVARRR